MPDNVSTENRPKVLIAEGGSGLIASLKNAMGQAGFRVSLTSEITASVRLYAAGRHDLVILDAVGLEEDCCKACRNIRSFPEGPFVPILVIVRAEDTGAGTRAFDAGATDVVIDSVDPEFLVCRIQNILRDGERLKSFAEREHQQAVVQRLAQVGSWTLDPSTGAIRGSEEMFRILGMPRHSVTITFENFLLAVQPSDRHLVASSIVSACKQESSCSLEFKIRRTDSPGERTLRLLCQPYAVAENEEPRLQGALQDITDMREGEEQLRLLKQAIDCLSIGITVSDIEGRIIYSNPAEAEIHGCKAEDVVSEVSSKLAHETCRKAFTLESLKNAEVMRRESINVRKNGEEFPVQLTSIAVRNPDGRCTGVVTTCEDIASQKEAERKIHKLAYFDPLTGLPNRGMFLDRFHQALALALREQRRLCLVFLDLDNFKDINDSHGHDFGDKLLREVAVRLESTMRESDTLARFGGDEFVLLLTSITSQESPALAAQRILSVFSQPIEINGRQVYSSASVGLAMYPDDGTDAESLFKCADTAMYHAKNEGKSRYHFFSREMNLKIMRRVALENSLRQGLEKDEFFLHYQPKWDVKTSRMLGAEVLLRWRSPDFGLIHPSEFILLTESSGLIFDLGNWVLRAACSQVRKWTTAGHPDFKVAVNVSGKQLRRPDFYEMVESVVRDSGIDPRALELEFTESVIMEQADKSVTTLESLRKLGVQLSIDDFGTGYSSLNFLKNFPVDRINIDRSFVADVNQSNDAAALVEAIISMGHSLNLKVLAEGVETGDQLQFLTDLGCDEVQGFYLAQPMSSVDLTRRMAHDNSRSNDWGALAGIRDDDSLVMWSHDAGS